jgi:hypothetical protein
VTTREAREIIRSGISVLCQAAWAQFTPRPVIRSEPGGPARPEPEPLAAITAAVALSREATMAVRDHARTAREDGCTWDEIGEAMGYDTGARYPEPDRAGAAFALLASDLGHGPAFTWTCASCLGVILDCGPGTGSPAEAEHGHADSCTRLAEAVKAYDAQWEDGGDEGSG